MKKTPAHSTPKLGPGEYRPDVTFTRLEDLPPPKIVKQRRMAKAAQQHAANGFHIHRCAKRQQLPIPRASQQ
jgi:hypothetical protein